MYAILKNPRGLPIALFHIERETPKRFYGRLTDTINGDSWFWLTGLTKGGRDRPDFCLKSIVMCMINTDNAWHTMKPDIIRIKAAWQREYNAIQEELNDAREVARTAEIEAQAAARKQAKHEVSKYVIQTAMLPL